jgi:acetyltransferase
MRAQIVADVEPKGACPEQHPLDVFFAPQAVAVFGATEALGSTGRTLMSNLIGNPFGGMLFPISQKQFGVMGIKAYPSLAEVPRPVELAIIATPAATVPDILRDCSAAGVKGAIILSAGFGETGPAGAELERRIRQQLHHGSLRVLGPNCLGIACPRTGLNATFAPAMVPAGNVGFLSQSGALLTALLSRDRAEQVGCSAFISLGAALDVRWAEWIDYLAADPQTECLGIYLEKLDDARSFFAAVRRVAPHKPVILVKGQGTAGPRDEVFEEACRCNGVLRVHRLADLFRMAEILTTQPAARGRRLTILTNARGPGLLAAHALKADGGLLAPLAPETVRSLGRVLPPGDRQNPIDIGDDADLERFAGAAAVAVQDPNTDAVLAVLTPHATMDAERAAERLADLAVGGRKPLLACWLFGASNPGSLSALQAGGIPSFRSPDAAVRAFGHLWRHGENLRRLAELSAVLEEAAEQAAVKKQAARIIAGVRDSGRTLLTRAECQQLLSAYALPMPKAAPAESETEAVELAEALEYPVVLVLASETGWPGGAAEEIQLQARGAAAVRRAFRTLRLIAREYLPEGASFHVAVQPLIPHNGYEVALSSTTEGELGPVIQLGVGGRWATLSRDRVVVLPPLSPQMVREMIEESALFTALRATAEQESVDLDALQQFLTGVGRLVVEQRWIKELTINPLLVSPERVLALEARVVLHQDVEDSSHEE